MKLTASKRVSRVEIKSAGALQTLAEEQRKKKIEAREQWRKDNHERIRWQMFLSLYGPDSDWCTFDPDPEDHDSCVEKVAEIAYSAQFRDVLKHYNDHLVDYSHMRGCEGAFAFAIELFYEGMADADLLKKALCHYGAELPSNTPYIELAKKKIAEHGLEWMQIAYSDEMQQIIEEQAIGSWISKDFFPLFSTHPIF